MCLTPFSLSLPHISSIRGGRSGRRGGGGAGGRGSNRCLLTAPAACWMQVLPRAPSCSLMHTQTTTTICPSVTRIRSNPQEFSDAIEGERVGVCVCLHVSSCGDMNLFTESPYWNKKNVPIIPITDYSHNVLWKEEKLLSLFVCECVWLRERKCVYCQGGCNATTQPPAVDGWEISRKRGLTVNRDFSRDVMRTLRVASHIWRDTTNGKMCILQLASERLPKVSGYHWVK